MAIACPLMRVLFLACLLCAPTAAQTTWYVDVHAWPPPGIGTLANPYTSIQYAIDQPGTLGGDRLLILPGYYSERINLNGKSLTLEGMSGASSTVLDGYNGGPPTVPGINASVVTVVNGESATLKGLTIQRGFGASFPPYYWDETSGGGLYVDAHSLTILDCIIQDNSAALYGGGIYAKVTTTLHVQDTIIRRNYSSLFGGGGYFSASAAVFDSVDVIDNGRESSEYLDTFQGGGLSGGASNLTLRECSFVGNTASCYGGGAQLYGQSLLIDKCLFDSNYSLSYVTGAGAEVGSPSGLIRDTVFVNNRAGLDGHAGALLAATLLRLEGCLFEDNVSPFWYGGAIVGDVDAHDSIFRRNRAGAGGAVKGGGSYTNCVFENNVSTGADSGLSFGGAIWAENNPLLLRCVFRGNSSTSEGGATFEECRLFNCTLFGNSASITGGGAMSGTLTNCIAWNNFPNNLAGNAVATYSDIQGGWPGMGNINLDPLFWGAAWGDLRLLANSPCIDSGKPNSPPDPDGSIADMGAYPFDPNYCPEPAVYCASKLNLLGCLPSMSTTGEPSLSGPDEFTIRASDLTSVQAGILIWSQGSSAMPFYGGTLCVQPPVIRAGIQNSGGNSQQFDCSGTFSFHFSQAYMAQHLLGVGTTLYAQYWMRDVADPAGLNVGLTDGLRFSVCP